ncbi:hypothetical protein QBC44DRAFT_354407 [Cladorrhinum sp. PSN332]|nr:hypothetical protein QBC44DRAFT_354407 [Cladorrhinum sp. PSN332]
MATKPTSKSIFICFDGTANNEQSGTNIHRLYQHAAEIPSKQAKCYVTGLGADWDWNMIGGSFAGKGIEGKLWKGYDFLVKNSSRDTPANDKLSVVGFSRGAFTASCFVTFLNDVGLSAGLNQEQQFIKLFTSWREARESSGTFDRQKFLVGEGLNPSNFQPKIISALGLFDTVAALEGGRAAGMAKPTREKLAFIDGVVPPNVKNAYHALALFEHRRDFGPAVWTSWPPKSNVRQCWFAGCHSDVGGFSTNKHPIHHFALLWMMAVLNDFVMYNTWNLMQDITASVGAIAEKYFSDSYDGNILFIPKAWHIAGSEDRQLPTLGRPTEEQLRKSQSAAEQNQVRSIMRDHSIHWTTASFVAWMAANGRPCHPLQAHKRLPPDFGIGGRPCRWSKAQTTIEEEIPSHFEMEFLMNWADSDAEKRTQTQGFINEAGTAHTKKTALPDRKKPTRGQTLPPVQAATASSQKTAPNRQPVRSGTLPTPKTKPEASTTAPSRAVPPKPARSGTLLPSQSSQSANTKEKGTAPRPTP